MNLHTSLAHHCATTLLLLAVIAIMSVQSVPITDKSIASNGESIDGSGSSLRAGIVRRSAAVSDSVLRLLKPHHKIDKRSITAFVTDPALLVTILHSLEVAYWTMPFGFLLQPIINLFRMPNRRADIGGKGFNFNSDAKVRELYSNLIRSIHRFETLEHRQQV